MYWFGFFFLFMDGKWVLEWRKWVSGLCGCLSE